jgi:hypothetical protein
VSDALVEIAPSVRLGGSARIGVERLNLFPRIRLRDHLPDRRHIGSRVLGVEIAPRHFLGAREFALESKDEGQILTHRPIGIGVCRSFAQRGFGLWQFF